MWDASLKLSLSAYEFCSDDSEYELLGEIVLDIRFLFLFFSFGSVMCMGVENVEYFMAYFSIQARSIIIQYLNKILPLTHNYR